MFAAAAANQNLRHCTVELIFVANWVSSRSRHSRPLVAYPFPSVTVVVVGHALKRDLLPSQRLEASPTKWPKLRQIQVCSSAGRKDVGFTTQATNFYCLFIRKFFVPSDQQNGFHIVKKFLPKVLCFRLFFVILQPRRKESARQRSVMLKTSGMRTWEIFKARLKNAGEQNGFHYSAWDSVSIFIYQVFSGLPLRNWQKQSRASVVEWSETVFFNP